MPLSSSSVGATGDWFSTPIDARWTMAYAAGLGESSAQYMDTASRPDVLAHPLFPVCFEDDPHWNEAGTDLAARTIFDFCVEQGCFD